MRPTSEAVRVWSTDHTDRAAGCPGANETFRARYGVELEAWKRGAGVEYEDGGDVFWYTGAAEGLLITVEYACDGEAIYEGALRL